MLVLCLAFLLQSMDASAQVIPLDSFESDQVRVVQPNTTDASKYLWNLYTGAGSGPTATTNSTARDGARSLKSTFTGGHNWQFQFYSYTEGLPGFSNGWKYLRQLTPSPQSWPMGKINRMRFWIKMPNGLSLSPTGNHNFEFGTYIRSIATAENVAESDNHHHYHFFDFKSTGEWEQVIVDTHPDHIRGAVGDTEWPDQIYPYADGNTYFDLMTRFYLDFPYATPAPPVDFYMDGFELYSDSRAENVAQVRSIHSVYIPRTNELAIGWGRAKNEDSVKHEVRYSFSDIYATGWNAATVPPNGTITPTGNGGYNTMSWSSTSLPLSGKSKVFVAIKPQNSSLFRQIEVPIAAPSALAKPQNLRFGS